MHAETAYLFRHALMRDAAYQLQLPGDRARLHLLALEILEAVCAGDQEAEDALALDLADHAAQAAATADADQPEVRRRELGWLLRALDHADRTFRNEERLALGLRVETHPAAETTHKVKAMIHVSKARHRLGKMSAALEASRRAAAYAEISPVLDDLPAALIALQSDLDNCGKKEAAHEALQKALVLAKDRSKRVYVDALIMLLQELRNARQFDEVRRRLDEIESLLGHQPTAGAKARVHYTHAMLGLETAGHDITQALEFAQSAIQEIRQLGQLDIETALLFNIGVHFADRGMTAEAKSWYRRALRLSDEIGNRSIRVSLLSNLGNVSFYMEARYLEALDFYRTCLAEALESGQILLALSSCGDMGSVLTSLGRLDEAEEAYRRVQAIANLPGGPGAPEWLKESFAELFIERGDLARAEQLLSEYLRELRELDHRDKISFTLKQLAWIWMRRGMLGMARSALDESIQHAEQLLWPTYAVQAHAARGSLALLLGDVEQAALDHAALESIAKKSNVGRMRISASVMPGIRDAAYEASAKTDPPTAATVARLQELAAEYERSAALGDSRLLVSFRKSSEDIALTVAEVVRAREAHQPAQLFNGTRPEKLTPELRVALIDRLSILHPERLAQLRVERPGVLACMLEGTAGLPVPDWRSTIRP